MLKFDDLLNESGLEFTDISSEESREYRFTGRNAYIKCPVALNVSESGGHRILDAEGVCHYIPTGWVQLTWKSKIGKPHFVK